MNFKSFPELAEAWRASVHGERLRAVRRAGMIVRERILADGPVAGLATCPVITIPYPSLFAFSGAALSPAPYIMMTNKMNVVQFVDWDGQLRTLLFNPSDIVRNEKTPFYANLAARYGSFLSHKVMSQKHQTVSEHLKRLGLSPEDVDYIAFDHLHIQDVRGWLGSEGIPGFFPRAKLLIQRAEWEAAKDLHPMQFVWYCPNGISGLDESRVVFLEGDAWLGKGVAILATPGHTYGNMSLAVTTDRGLFVISENGVATESYSPLQSAIVGVRATAEQLGHEVVLNGNTREGSLDQYTSMILEKTVAGPAKVDPSYVNFYPSSELTASILAPGYAPTFSHGDLSQGDIRRPSTAPFHQRPRAAEATA